MQEPERLFQNHNLWSMEAELLEAHSTRHSPRSADRFGPHHRTGPIPGHPSIRNVLYTFCIRKKKFVYITFKKTLIQLYNIKCSVDALPENLTLTKKAKKRTI